MHGTPHSSGIASLVAAGVLPRDPLEDLLGADEPSARFVALHGVAALPAVDPRVVAARRDVLADPRVLELLDSLPPADPGAWVTDHHDPRFLPNRLAVLSDLGVRAGDDPRIDALGEALLSGTDARGRLTHAGEAPASAEVLHASAVCDSNAAVDALLRLGFADEPRLATAVRRLERDAFTSAHGRGWECAPGRAVPAWWTRKVPACPQVTLEGVRVLSRLAPDRRPAWSDDAARTLLAFWSGRAEERPHDFGHGYQFKTVRWPSVWYDALGVLDTVGRFPAAWSGPDGSPKDRRAVAELAASLIASNLSDDGLVHPERTHPGFERFSFGRRDAASPLATAWLLAALVRVAALADDIAAIDVDALPPSRAAGKRERPDLRAVSCPAPRGPAYDPARVVPRVLARHHLGTPWEPASIESLAADLVGLVAADPSTPYLSAAARLPGFDGATLDRALDERRSLVRMRCMRGVLYAVRRDLVDVVHAASVRQVVRHARDFAVSRGVGPHDYEQTAEAVLAASHEQPLTIAELRAVIRPRVDLAAVVTLMLAEARIVRCAPRDGRFGHRFTVAPFDAVLPGVTLGHVSEDDARAILLRAYVRGFGPVSARDAAWWTGMDLKRVRRAFDALEDELVEIGLAGRDGTWLMHAADADELERASVAGGAQVALLPALDPLLLSYTDRSRFVADAVRPYVFDPARNVTSVVLVGGEVAGVWDAASEPFPTARVHLFGEQTLEVREAIETEARRMAAVRLGVASVGVGFVDGMTPLSERRVGAFRHPLR